MGFPQLLLLPRLERGLFPLPHRAFDLYVVESWIGNLLCGAFHYVCLGSEILLCVCVSWGLVFSWSMMSGEVGPPLGRVGYIGRGALF